MKNICKIFCFIFLIFTSCNTATQENKSDIRVRITIESEKSEVATVKVYVESQTGNSITGALVIIRNNQNSTAIIPYDSSNSCYYVQYPIPLDSELIITVDSLASDSTKEFVIPHTLLTTGANITSFRDSIGNSVLSGQYLKKDNDIQISWDSVCEDAVYFVTIKTALETKLQLSTKNTSILIPANSISSAGTYYVQIQTQKIFGDPLFKTASYYSVSVYSNSNLGFSIE